MIVRIKKIVLFFLRFAAAFLCVNLLFFVFCRDAMWLKRSGGATEGIYYPGHYIMNLDEGMGYKKVDRNGYLNVEKELADNYVLVFGKSHTNANEVDYSKRYSSVLDSLIGNGEKLHVYSVTKGGSTFADMICGFNALVTEFPNSSDVIFEIDSIGNPSDFKFLSDQRKYTDEDTPEFLIKNINLKEYAFGRAKEFLPLAAYVMTKKAGALKIDTAKMFWHGEINKKSAEVSDSSKKDTFSDEVYVELCTALNIIRNEYDNRIIFMVHPNVRISKSGEMEICSIDYEEELVAACRKYDIEYINVGNTFKENYINKYEVPYGFWNTSMGQGHMNEYGHRAVALALFESFFKEDRL